MSEAGQYPAPLLFAAVSSLRARAPIVDHLAVISAARFPAALVSAADLATADHDEAGSIRHWASQYRAASGLLMLDSGGYEATWKGWTDWGPDELEQHAIQSDFAVASDSAISEHDAVAAALAAADAYAAIPQRRATVRLALPHATSPGVLAETIESVVAATDCTHVAIRERELGDGILDRLTNLAGLAASLQHSGLACKLHILGVGSPRDILSYAICGAHSFDGLEWCRCALDPVSGQVAGIGDWQVMRSRSPFIERLRDLPYFAACTLHNLLFLKEFMSWLQQSDRTEWLAHAERLVPTKVNEHLHATCHE